MLFGTYKGFNTGVDIHTIL